ncbi:MAG: VWA domain-containing protein [Gammaproteobacteria bacterium]
MSSSSAAAGGKLAANIVHFARVLRAAGMPVGPGKVLDAIAALRAVGITNRADFYWTLHAVFVNRRDQRELFDQAFHVFWRNPRLLERMLALVLPEMKAPIPEDEAPEMMRRLAEALHPGQGQGEEPQQETEIEIDATLTWSSRELLQNKDFEKMSREELAQAKQLLKHLSLGLEAVPTRRFRVSQRGERVDLRATLRNGLRSGGDSIPLVRKLRRRRHPPLVLLCDISGSMSRYSRMLLHFAHAVTNDRDRVYTFVFGTRLTNVTRQLRYKDVDEALEKVAEAVEDWSGGTTIGRCLHDFNRYWSRRVLAQGAVVLFISDGLDREGADRLADEMERLHKSCRRLIWLNPLLRYEGFQPRAQGARAILPHVDELRSAHNLNSLSELGAALNRSGPRREEGVSQWLQMLH